MRPMLTGAVAVLTFNATFLGVPVHAAPITHPSPVETSASTVPMGSVGGPAPGALVRAATGNAVAGVPGTLPALTVSRTGTEEFSLVGVTWAYDPTVTETEVRIRARSVAGTWGEWSEIVVQDPGQSAPETPGARVRGGTEPVWTGPSAGIEAEVVTRSGGQPRDVRLDLVDPGTSAADTVAGTPQAQDGAAAALDMPPVHSRAEWGADERVRTWEPEYAPTIRAATLHHTAETNAYTAAQVPAMIRAIYRYHAVSRGWGDIGYNVVVDKFGRLWEGRYGGLESTVVGAHAGGFNTGTFGVSMLGNYDQVDMTPPTVDAVAAFIAWKFSLFGLDPRADTTLTSTGGGTSRYSPGVSVTLPTIFAHGDVGHTACPGRYGHARLPEIRAAVAERLAGGRSFS